MLIKWSQVSNNHFKIFLTKSQDRTAQISIQVVLGLLLLDKCLFVPC